jgi:hypothetical protein
VAADGDPARIEVFEPEAEIVREIFEAYFEKGLVGSPDRARPARRGIPSSTGKPIWGTSTITRLLHDEAYIGTVYYNRRESLEATVRAAPGTARPPPRSLPEEWIPIRPRRSSTVTHSSVSSTSPGITPSGTRAEQWTPWLLHGLVDCGHCHLGCNCHKMHHRW